MFSSGSLSIAQMQYFQTKSHSWPTTHSVFLWFSKEHDLIARARYLGAGTGCAAAILPLFLCLFPRALRSSAFSTVCLYWLLNMINIVFRRFFPIQNTVCSKSFIYSTCAYPVAVWVVGIIFYIQSCLLLTHFYEEVCFLFPHNY